MKWQISLISMMEMTKFDLASHETAVKNAKQYKINTRLIESWPAERPWSASVESSGNHLGWKVPLRVL